MIELTIMDHGPAFSAGVQELVDRFQTEQRADVRLRVLPWRGAWADFVKIGLYGDGPDVSEVGSTWVSEFASMNALRPFVKADVTEIGGPSRFLRAAWNSGTPYGQALTWAVPWQADTRILHYRRDILERAGIDLGSAFLTAEALSQTLAGLRSAGVPSPWVVPTHRSRMTLHNVACWAWGAGGDFVSSDLKHTAFARPEAKAGIRAYFDLVRYLSPSARHLDESQSDALFWSGQAAMTISGPWLMREAAIPPDVSAHVGRVLPPGAPYVGGTHLVIWKHTPQPDLALALVRLLAGKQAQAGFFEQLGILPTHLDVLAEESFVTDPFYRTVSEGLKAGRSFPSFTLWGLIENKLTEAFAALWADVLAVPDPDVAALVDRHLNPAAQRLDSTLAYQ